MFQKIVVPLDGSKEAEHALDVALYFAKLYDAELLLIQVSDLPITMAESMGQKYLELREQLRQESIAYLKRLEAKLQLRDKVQTRVVEGHPVERLLEVCKEFSADLVVMTSHGRSGFERWLLGSVTESFARRSPAPVLILRGSNPVHLPLGKKILVTLDGSTTAEAILPVATSLAEQAQGELVLFHSYHDGVSNSFEFADHELYPPKEGERGLDEVADIARTYLDKKVETLKSSSVKAVGKSSKSYPAEAILEMAEAEDVDLIALTSHGATGLTKWIFGSVAEKILRHADRPILIKNSD